MEATLTEFCLAAAMLAVSGTCIAVVLAAEIFARHWPGEREVRERLDSVRRAGAPAVRPRGEKVRW